MPGSTGPVHWRDWAGGGVLAYQRDHVLVAANTSGQPVTLPLPERAATVASWSRVYSTHDGDPSSGADAGDQASGLPLAPRQAVMLVSQPLPAGSPPSR